ERQYGQPGGKSPRRRRPAPALIERRNAATAAAPLVEVAHDQHRLVAGVAVTQGREQAARLLAPLAPMQTQMRDDDAQRTALDDELGIDGAARLVAADAEVDMAQPAHGKARQQRIAEAAAMIAQMRAAGRREAGHLGEKAPLLDEASEAMARIDLLQPDDVGMEFAQHLADALGIVAVVDADAAMHVVGRRDEGSAGAHRPATTACHR